MADIAVDSTRKINIVFPETAEIRDFREAETLAVGDFVYVNANGKVAKASAAAAGTAQARGIVVSRQGKTVSVMKKGYLAGFIIASLAYDAQLFLSNTAGALADAAGTVSVPVGRISCFTNDQLTKIAYFDFNWVAQFA